MNDNQKVTNLAPNMELKPALCLDFDGTIRRSKKGTTFIKNFEDIELMPGIEEAINKYAQNNYLIIGISNQGSVAHGIKLPMEIELELQTTLDLFHRNPFHIVKMCYHMADGNTGPYNHRSLLRKPDIGMLATAEIDAFNNGIIIDWDNSLFVGDRPEDEACAKNANIVFIHIDKFLSTENPIAPNQEKLPKNIQDAVAYLLPLFDGMEKLNEFEKGKDSFAAYCHSQLSGGIGMQIRNMLGLWDEQNTLRKAFLKENINHPDQMSDHLVKIIYKIMKEKQTNG